MLEPPWGCIERRGGDVAEVSRDPHWWLGTKTKGAGEEGRCKSSSASASNRAWDWTSPAFWLEQLVVRFTWRSNPRDRVDRWARQRHTESSWDLLRLKFLGKIQMEPRRNSWLLGSGVLKQDLGWRCKFDSGRCNLRCLTIEKQWPCPVLCLCRAVENGLYFSNCIP